MLLAIVGSAPVAVEVGKRNFGEWAELKRLLRENEAVVHQFIGREGGALPAAEYEKAREWFQQNPVAFQFKELPHPVKVQLMRAVPPYVGVDFGEGRNALFNLDTMLCTYSD